MKRTFILSVFNCIFLLTTTQAQLGGLLKKKKDKTEQQPADTAVAPVTAKEEPEKKKSGGGFFQKVVGKVAKVAGGAAGGLGGMVATADNLDNVDVIASVGTNIYSKDLGLMFTDFLGKEWINNGDFTMLQLASKDAFTMYKYAGTVKVNGKELKHASMGVHTATENPGSGNKKISFEKNGVVEGSFEIPLPARNIKLVSINGQNKNINVDLTKDVQLELANFSTGPGALVRVDVITTQIGIRTLSMVAYVKPADKVTIPAAAFRNIENTNNFNFKNCYLSVSEQEQVKAINPAGKIPASQVAITGSNDGMWINVTASNDNNKGFTFESGAAVVEKKNAAFAMPLSFAKNVAASSFYTYGTTQLYDQKTNNWTKTETTKSIDFPQIPDAYLDAILDDLYKKFTATLTAVNGSNIMPVTAIPGAPSYASTIKFMPGEVNNEGEFLKVYKGLNPVKTLSSVSNRYYGENALLKDVQADALLKVSLACALSWDKKPMMTPHLTVELIGASNGDFRSFMGNTKYFTINITGAGYELKKNKPVEFDKVFQVGVFDEQFKKALQELKAKEETNGDYEKVWSLQK